MGLIELAIVEPVAQQIRYHRKRKGWTVDDLSRRSGVSSEAIGDFERGIHEPLLSTLIKLMSALNVGFPHLMVRYERKRDNARGTSKAIRAMVDGSYSDDDFARKD